MGGGKSSSWGGGGGGGQPPISTEDLISAREGKQKEVDEVLSVMRDFQSEYGVTMDDIEIGVFPSGQNTMGYHDPNTGNIGMNKAYFDSQKMDAVMDQQAKIGAHPPRGNKTGIEAVMAHEAGHKVNYIVADKHGMTAEKMADKIINESAQKIGYKNTANMANKISKYALKNTKEAIAEAFGDVYCNGKNAKLESKTIVDITKGYL